MKKFVLLLLVSLCFVLVSQAQTKHAIGEKFNGGIVFDISANGLHGLIAETKDQGMCQWSEAPKLIANPQNHSEDGKAFTDWRLPTKDELNTLYLKKDIVGGFINSFYWSSTGSGEDGLWIQFFVNGQQGMNGNITKLYVRAVRTF